MDEKSREIEGLSVNYLGEFSHKNLKIDGIGIGNTFNEMYEKFGRLDKIEVEKSEFVDYVLPIYNLGGV